MNFSHLCVSFTRSKKYYVSGGIITVVAGDNTNLYTACFAMETLKNYFFFSALEINTFLENTFKVF